ncbi:RNA-binding protein cabeza [Scaptodrosophila lebanonensis]|uniref:RNA-binding protein cabeza n=1 Tax=Drosophila lebanonensis TaxID=7225 RepID=A0A6J2T7S5_DROLE|nr:RNA-binding protein cabeza [Scaptodrosophila lebanonensis]
MVDPNRKINRVTETDIDFLEACEEEFALRYTDDDPEFMAHCSKPLPDPPLVENWQNGNGSGGGGGGGGGGSGHYNNRYNGHRRGGDRGWQRRSGGGGYHNNDRDRGYRDNRNRPNHRYEPSARRDRYREQDRNGAVYNERNNEQSGSSRGGGAGSGSGSPLKVRRDYGKFVPASKD